MSVSTVPPQHVVLEGISYETYERMLDDIGNRPIKLSFDRGTLEIMSPSQEHEQRKGVIGRLVEAMTEVLDVPICSAGSTTWRRADLEQGLEPDEAYWVQNEPSVWNKTVELGVDPPPDLVIEVDVHSSCVNRMGIYAALGVPEVWRHDGERLRINLLQQDAGYAESDQSRCFPWLPFDEFARWVGRRSELRETAWIRAFRTWVREHVGVE